MHLCEEWGIPFHPEKFEGSSTCILVLGVELDSLALQALRPPEKFDRIAALLETCSAKKHYISKSFIGNLQHACKVITKGRTFLGCMINLLSALRRDDHPIRIGKQQVDDWGGRMTA